MQYALKIVKDVLCVMQREYELNYTEGRVREKYYNIKT